MHPGLGSITLDQEWANGGSEAKSGLPPVFVNKVLLEYMHIHKTQDPPSLEDCILMKRKLGN